MRKICFLVVTMILSFRGSAQTPVPILERKISLKATGEALPDLLARIGQTGKFSFSYNSTIIHSEETVTLDANSKTVREVLNQIFRGSMDYKEKGNHLILTKVPLRSTPKASTSVIVSGYIENGLTKERMPDVSVYDKKSISSVISDEYGYFRLRVDLKDQAGSMAISKSGYQDTVVTFQAPGNQFFTVSIFPVLAPVIDVTEPNPTDSVRPEKKEELLLPYDKEPNIRNIHDTLYQDIQISFLPFIGSNGRLSGNVINNYSINIFGGVSLGTRQIELGFFANIDRGDVHGLQIAGLGNLVGRHVYGVQGSGFFNVNGGDVTAVQMTGFGNVNFGSLKGVQVAGFGNVNLASVDGVQVAGFTNVNAGRQTGPSEGVQVAGFCNVHLHDFSGPQIAGFSNISPAHVTGSQISGFFNYGKKIRGTQIGLFNYADTLGGVPVGLVSFVRHGYHKLEMSADEVFYSNLAFRTGVPKFYNVLFAGMKPEEASGANSMWTFGYGVGTAPRLTQWLDLNIDLTGQHVNKENFDSSLSLLTKLHVGFDFRAARKLSIYAGVTLNGYFTKASNADNLIIFTGYQPYVMYDYTYDNDTNLKMWFGGKLALRLL